MQISELMTRPATFCSPDATCVEIAQMMRDHDIGSVPVAENERLVGMVTDRDIVLRAVAEGAGGKERLAREVMTGEMLYCFADADPAQGLEKMGEMQGGRVPVVDREKNLVGLVSIGDLAGNARDASVGKTEAAITETPAA